MPDTSINADLPDETAAHYDAFFGPMYFEPYAIAVANRIDAGDASVILELAAGTGRVTRHIRERIAPSAKLIASDISEDMLAIAKKKLSHLDIEWRYIDAQQLPFPDNSIDVIICCFGYMFVPDKQKALTEALRVMKQGGQLLFTTWDKLENNGSSFISRTIAEKYSREPSPRSSDLATSMNDETEIKSLLEAVGFRGISIEKVRMKAICNTAKEAAGGLVSGVVYEGIKKNKPALMDVIRIEVEKTLAEKYGAAPMVAPMSALIAEAWK